MNAAITTDIDNLDELRKKLIDSPEMEGLELASKVSTKKAYFLGNAKAKYRLAVLDLGVKKNILSNFINRDFYIKVFLIILNLVNYLNLSQTVLSFKWPRRS